MSANVFFQYVVQVALTAGKFIPDIGWLFEIGKALVQKHKDIKQDQRLAELEAAMQATPQQVREIVQLEIARLKQAGKQVSPALEKEVTERLTVMPALIRQRLNQATRQAKRQGTTLIQALPIGDQASEDSKLTFYNQLFPSRSLHFQIGDNVPHRTPVWQLKELLGIGSVGEVWKATSELGDSVAVKFCLDEAAAKLLKNEVKTLQELRRQLPKHPQIVQLREIQLEQMPYWLAFEYVEGGTLENLMQTKTFSWQQSVDLIMPLIQAMAKVHEVGIIHRDLKPANILITDENTLKITDFGIGKILFKSTTIQTQTAGIWGFTEMYACEEQRRGEIAHPSDDVYALAMILAHLITNKSRKLALDEIEDLSIPPALQKLLQNCLFKSRAKRPANAKEMLEILELVQKFNTTWEVVYQKLANYPTYVRDFLSGLKSSQSTADPPFINEEHHLQQLRNQTAELERQRELEKQRRENQIKTREEQQRLQAQIDEEQAKQYFLKHGELSPKNPLDWSRLLVWILWSPDKLKRYREVFDQESEKYVGSWLASSLILLPLFLTVFALALALVPLSPKAWTTQSYFIASGIVAIAWFLMGIFEHINDENAFGVAGVVSVAVAFGVAGVVSVAVAFGVAGGGVAFGVAFGVAGVVVFGVAGGVASVVASVVASWVAFGVVAVVAFGVVLIVASVVVGGGVAGGVVLIVASVVVAIVASSIEENFKKSFETGKPSYFNRVILILLIASYAFLIWFFYLKGWQYFN
jgi:serine/threonine protein kinase